MTQLRAPGADHSTRQRPVFRVVTDTGHSGLIFTSDEAADVIRDVQGVHGFLGASSMERLPTEIAMVEHMSKYTQISLPAGTR